MTCTDSDSIYHFLRLGSILVIHFIAVFQRTSCFVIQLLIHRIEWRAVCVRECIYIESSAMSEPILCTRILFLKRCIDEPQPVFLVLSLWFEAIVLLWFHVFLWLSFWHGNRMDTIKKLILFAFNKSDDSKTNNRSIFAMQIIGLFRLFSDKQLND